MNEKKIKQPVNCVNLLITTCNLLLSPGSPVSPKQHVASLPWGRHGIPDSYYQSGAVKVQVCTPAEFTNGWRVPPKCSRVIYPGPPRTWDPLMGSGTHTIPISLGIRKWEWYGNSMGSLP